MAGGDSGGALKRTPLYEFHKRHGAKMVPFAGYEMPVQYPLGVLKEHLHCRTAAGLFDVSHMGQALLSTPSGGDVAGVLEQVVPGNITGLKANSIRYTQLLNHKGGIIDDLMVTRLGEREGRDQLFLVVNGACKDGDFRHIEAKLGTLSRLEVLADQALLALQGPQAAAVLETILPGVAAMGFMTMRKIAGTPFGDMLVSRSGYTGEDGYEVSLDGSRAEAFAEALVAMAEVEPIGLGARDSLRLEAGLCLYGHDIDETTSPVEANLVWSMGKQRLDTGDFPGADRILGELDDGPSRRLVGIRPEGRAPAREGTRILDAAGTEIGIVTSGGFGPSVNGPVAMGYLRAGHEAADTPLQLEVRGKLLPARVAALPFVPHRYYRKPKSV
jgi:aminomethyltransferase